MTNRLHGEEVFAQVFQFRDSIPVRERDKLRDFLYKFAHNFLEAKEYLAILQQADSLEYSVRSELLFRIHMMALQCFPLAIRRMTDGASRRSVRELVTISMMQDSQGEEMQKIAEVYSHYKRYLDKGIVHQDEQSTKEVLESFPDSDLIEQDMEYLRNLYLRITELVCSKSIDIDRVPHDYRDDLQKLLTVKDIVVR